MSATINITLLEIESYSQRETVKAMQELINTLKEEIERLKALRKLQENDLLFRHYDICIFEVKQIIKMIKHIHPELYKIDGERF